METPDVVPQPTYWQRVKIHYRKNPMEYHAAGIILLIVILLSVKVSIAPKKPAPAPPAAPVTPAAPALPPPRPDRIATPYGGRA